jgi:hypothetical protein
MELTLSIKTMLANDLLSSNLGYQKSYNMY